MAPKIANRRLIAACSITELIKLLFTTARGSWKLYVKLALYQPNNTMELSHGPGIVSVDVCWKSPSISWGCECAGVFVSAHGYPTGLRKAAKGRTSANAG